MSESPPNRYKQALGHLREAQRALERVLDGLVESLPDDNAIHDILRSQVALTRVERHLDRYAEPSKD